MIHVMWEIEKAILVTNNDRVLEKYKDTVKVIFAGSYEEVLIKVRDLVYDRYILLTHPQASSLKQIGRASCRDRVLIQV